MIDKIDDETEKAIAQSEKTGDRSLKLWLLWTFIALCLSAAVLIFSLGALTGTAIQLNKQSENGFDINDLKSDKIRIYIDQGHNPAPYHNTGAEGNGLYEQDLTFSIGCLLADMLTEDERFEVSLSRPTASTVLGTDNTSSLKARVDGSAEFNADYFISLHINAFTQESANGIEVFSLTNAGESYHFGTSLLNGMVNSTGLRDRGMKQNPELYVLKNASMPAVLLEMGFISNADDARLLSERPELFAQGIYEGISEYFESAYIRDLNIWLFTVGISAFLTVVSAVMIFIIKKRTKEQQCSE